MPILTFNLTDQLNILAQVGDVVYYVPTSTSAQFEINSNDVVEIGPITFININDRLSFSCSTSLPPGSYPNSSDYLLFSKDNKVNQASVLGYYAKVQLKNDSKEKAEIYAISADCFESSK